MAYNVGYAAPGAVPSVKAAPAAVAANAQISASGLSKAGHMLAKYGIKALPSMYAVQSTIGKKQHREGIGENGEEPGTSALQIMKEELLKELQAASINRLLTQYGVGPMTPEQEEWLSLISDAFSAG